METWSSSSVDEKQAFCNVNETFYQFELRRVMSANIRHVSSIERNLITIGEWKSWFTAAKLSKRKFEMLGHVD